MKAVGVAQFGKRLAHQRGGSDLPPLQWALLGLKVQPHKCCISEWGGASGDTDAEVNCG